jgi:hypothetical protein
MAAGTEEGAPPDNQIATLYLGGGVGGDGGRWEGDGRGGEETKKGDREQGETG